MSDRSRINRSPLIIAGMHRSGTSLTASILKRSGIDIGSDLFSADQHNQRGYFEDVDFLEFQREILQRSCGDREPGWPDWGWAAAETLDKSQWNQEISEAETLIEPRQKKRHWGWKDPRTTLMLDFWRSRLPDAKFILVYRFPWDVADSIFRIGHPYFIEQADMGIRAWFFYNWHLLDFYRRHSNQAVLFNINALQRKPDFLVDALVHKLGYDGTSIVRPDSQDIIEPGLMGQLPLESPLVQGIRAITPRYMALLSQLDQHSDLPSTLDHSASPTVEVKDLQTPPLNFPERHLLALYAQKLQQERQYAQDAHNLGERLNYLESALRVYERSIVTRGYVKLKRRFLDRWDRFKK